MKHLYSNQSYDESEVWCAKDRYYVADGEATDRPEDADCTLCLDALVDFAARAVRRLRELRGKDWNACPIDAHANDCDCGGSAGDR